MDNEALDKPRESDFYSICGTCPTGCCREARPPLTPKRKQVISSFLDSNGVRMTYPFEDKEYSFPKESADGYCVFLDKKSRKCQIHPVKPETCVAGPITFDVNLQTGKIEWWIKRDKICPLAGALYRDKDALQKHMESAKREILQFIRDMDPNALRVVLTVDEPETFKFDEDALDPDFTEKLRGISSKSICFSNGR